MKHILLFSAAIVISLPLLASPKSKSTPKFKSMFIEDVCQSQPPFLKESKIEISKKMNDLPVGLYVAKQAEHYIEKKNESGLIDKIYEKHFFSKKGESQILSCDNSLLKNENFRFQLSAPTVIDRTENGNIGHSIWNFQLYSNNSNLKSWNVKSPLASAKDIETFMNNIKATYQIYQLSHNEYEVVLSQNLEQGARQYLSVRYQVY